jgi:hypothetical protein
VSRTPNRFTDPLTAGYYDWQVNHNEETVLGKTRNVTESAPTGLVGLIKQQSEESPLVLGLKGKILHKNQHDQFVGYWIICHDRSIYFRDFAGNEYEVMILDFLPTRKMCARNPADPIGAPLWTWDYEIKMDVLRVISGDWVGVTP